MNESEERSFWEELGSSLCAPLYFSFAYWIREQAEAAGASRILFLAREGHILQRVWDLCCARQCPHPTHYVWASRRCFSMAGLRSIDAKGRHFLLSGKGLTARERLHQLGWDWPVANDDSTDGSWLEDPDLQKRVLVTAAMERANMIGYLESIGLMQNRLETALVVDTGWHGSLQAHLQALMEEARSRVRLQGCYLGTIDPLADGLDSNNCRGLFFNQSSPHPVCRAFQHSLLLVETLFAAQHPTVLWMRRTSNGYEPFFAQDQEDPEDLARIELMQRSALRTLEEKGPFWSKNPEAVRASALASLTGLLQKPSCAEAAHLGNLRLFGGFGQAPRREPLALPDRSGKWTTLRDQYRRCNWRAGFMARLSTAERVALRPLIVGMRRDRR